MLTFRLAAQTSNEIELHDRSTAQNGTPAVAGPNAAIPIPPNHAHIEEPDSSAETQEASAQHT